MREGETDRFPPRGTGGLQPQLDCHAGLYKTWIQIIKDEIGH